MNMLMLKQKLKLKLSKLSLIFIAAVLAFGTVATVKVAADQFDQKINQLENQNSVNQGSLDQLISQANSYQDVINKLKAQISALQASIDSNKVTEQKLQVQIAEVQEQINNQKQVLGESIRSLYVQGQISTLEMLASSKDLSDFIDKQVYESSVQDKIKTELDKINALKLQLQKEKDQVDELIKEMQNQQGQLAQTKAKEDQLLAFNQNQQDAYNQKIQANNAKIADLRYQQAVENAKHFAGYTIVPGHNGRDTYPNIWRNSPQDSMMDNWGMFNRECVSYTAWKVYSTGRHMPYWGGFGNANQWPANARAYGIPVSSSPRPGDVAIAFWGSFGHAMYVDSVNGDGTINISQYNWDYHGTYSEIYHFSPAGLSFIHF